MTLTVLISCMHEKDTSIIERSNVQSDVVVVNQCDHNRVEEFNFLNKQGRICHAKFISTTERGLSKSRNMALLNSWGDICLIADDDERFADNYEEIIIKAFNELDSDVIVLGFHYTNRLRNNFTKRTKINWLNFLKVCSVQISFKRDAIMTNSIWFAENMGSGSGNGSGEENKFISDCLKKQLIIYAEPSDIAEIDYNVEGSKWFKGYDKNYFVKKGWSIKQSIGIIGASLFSVVMCIRRASLIKNDINPIKAFIYMIKGVFSNF